MSRVEQAVAALATLPAIEWVAAALALGYLLLAIRQSPWCWAFAIASALLYLVVFTRAGLYMQATLQVFYVGMAVYGWRMWRGVAGGAPVAISRWSWRRHLVALVAIALVAGINGALVAQQAGGDWVPFVDAAIAWGSVLTTWMVARKVIENWLYWIVLDAAMAALAATQGLAVTAVLFALYTALALRGYWQWRQDERAALVRPA
ncbi:MAG: nicotinamide riboside transporter PnuC [Steroidobacteraceae bacterium]